MHDGPAARPPRDLRRRLDDLLGLRRQIRIRANRPLFARIDGTETIQLDAKPAREEAKTASAEGKFWAATGDGSKAFFTAPGKLTADAKAEGQLYLYDTEASTLSDLTPGPVAPQILGVIGASEDGAYAYFVARGGIDAAKKSAPAAKKR